jgi:hypothetical protein
MLSPAISSFVLLCNRPHKFTKPAWLHSASRLRQYEGHEHVNTAVTNDRVYASPAPSPKQSRTGKSLYLETGAEFWL